MSKKANAPKKAANRTAQAQSDSVAVGKRLVELLLAIRRICESHEGNRDFPPLLPGWQAQLSSVLRELLQTRWGFRGSLGPNAERQLVDVCAENPHWAAANTFQAPLRLLSLIGEIEQAFWASAERAEIAAWKWESQQDGALPQELHADTTLRLLPRVAAVLADVDLDELGRSVAMQLALLPHETSECVCQDPPPYLDLKIDREKRTARRAGYERIVDFTKKDKAWELLLRLADAETDGCTRADLKKELDTDDSNLGKRKGRTNDLLQPLRVMIDSDQRGLWTLIAM